MRLVIQRVRGAWVEVEGREISRIGQGLLILFGAQKGDGREQAAWLAEKSLNLRIFADAAGKMNLSCLDVGGEVLAVSQFTLAGDCTRGRRPGFDNAAAPEEALDLYRFFAGKLNAGGAKTATGQFGADMLVHIQNDGPATFILER